MFYRCSCNEKDITKSHVLLKSHRTMSVHFRDSIGASLPSRVTVVIFCIDTYDIRPQSVIALPVDPRKKGNIPQSNFIRFFKVKHYCTANKAQIRQGNQTFMIAEVPVLCSKQ